MPIRPTMPVKPCSPRRWHKTFPLLRLTARGNSSSRFSHWFSEQAGLPFRSYKKWLKLLLAFELTQSRSLTDAAITAGFSDQAHFCRAAMEAFGVNPATIKQLLSEK
ncbi:MAG: helix-turn-helix domain-containing protein [Marinobacter sp.]